MEIISAHLCLGAPWARLETRIALEELLRRFPDDELVDGGAARVFGSNIRAPRTARDRPG